MSPAGPGRLFDAGAPVQWRGCDVTRRFIVIHIAILENQCHYLAQGQPMERPGPFPVHYAAWQHVQIRAQAFRAIGQTPKGQVPRASVWLPKPFRTQRGNHWNVLSKIMI